MSLTIRMFGEYSVLFDGEPVAIANKPRFQQLLAYLILHHDRSLLRAHVAYEMWPDASERQAQTNLRNLLFRLRKGLPRLGQCLRVEQTTVRWQPQIETQVDALEFLDLLTAASDDIDQQTQTDCTEAAVNIYRGNLLPALYDDWVLVHQERFRDLYAKALQQLVTSYESRREYDAASDYAKQLVAHDPLHERNHYQLMQHHMLRGDRAAALHAFHDCEAVLLRELDVAPGQEILTLYDQLVAGEKSASAAIGKSTTKQRKPIRVSGAGAAPLAIPMVGRHAEWAQLKHIYQELPMGHPQLALISGVAGIGKTRLAEELLHWASLQEITTATAHCYVSQRQTAYAPLVAWLRSDEIGRGLSTLTPVWLNEISRLLPELVERFPELPGPTPMHESWQRLRLFEAIARAISAAPEPIVLLLDDIQWVDPETLEWLQFFFNHPTQGRLLVVATQRLEEVAAGHPALIWQREMSRRGRAVELTLAGLPDEDVQQLGEKILGMPLDSSTSRHITTVTEGNPLFVAEMARARLAQDSKMTLAEETMWAELSDTIQSTIIYRLDRLSAETRQLIDLAAVIGREFTFELLEAASDKDQSTLVQALDEAWRKYVVREQGALSYDFSHDLIRAAAYNTMSTTQRQMMHRSVATALAIMAETKIQQSADQIAVHYEMGLMPIEAIEFYKLAAEQAQATYANAEATEFYRHLLEPPLAGNLSQSEQVNIRLELCAIDRVRGEWDAALAGYRDLLTDAIAEEDKGSQARAQQGIANVIRLQGAYDEALTWLSAAIDNFELVGDATGVMRTLWTMGEVYWYQGRYAEAMSVLQRQLDLASEHNSPRDICDATGTMGIVTWSMGRFDESERYCRQSVELARELDDGRAEARALITTGNIYASRKKTIEAAAWYRQTLDVAQQVDDQQCVGWAVANLGECFFKRWEFEAAQACDEYMAAQAVYMGDWWSATLAIANTADIHAKQQLWSEANRAYDLAMAMGEKLSIPYLIGMYNEYVRYLLLQGKIAEAEKIHQKAIDELKRTEEQFAGGEDVSFLANLNAIKLSVALETISTDGAARQFEALLEHYAETAQQAHIHHAIWMLDSRRLANRQQAITLCEAHFTEAQDRTLFDEYFDLTGKPLPELESLPDLPNDLLVSLLSMTEAYQAIERWLAE